MTITTYKTRHMKSKTDVKSCHISKIALQNLEKLLLCFNHSHHHNFQNEQPISNQEKNQIFFRKTFFHVILLKNNQWTSADALFVHVISDLPWAFRFLDFEPEMPKISHFEAIPAKDQGLWKV